MRPMRWGATSDECVGIEQLAEILGRSRRTMYRLVKVGLPHELEGCRFLFRLSDVQKWLKERSLIIVESAGGRAKRELSRAMSVGESA